MDRRGVRAIISGKWRVSWSNVARLLLMRVETGRTASHCLLSWHGSPVKIPRGGLRWTDQLRERERSSVAKNSSAKELCDEGRHRERFRNQGAAKNQS
jgi:hypothetical protein